MLIYSEKAQNRVYGSFEAYQDLFNEERQLGLHICSCEERKLIKDGDNHAFCGSHVGLQFRYDCLPLRFTQQDKPSC
jgi:hypothetical protein